MSEPFYQHLFPSRYRVLGRWLPPLSLWHVASLEALRSPFVTHQGSIEFADVQVAVKVCLSRWPKQPTLKPTIRDACMAWIYRHNHRRIAEQARIMFAHINAYSTPPRVWESVEEGCATITAPPILSRIARLASLGNMSMREIWNDVTPGFSIWLLLALAERDGAEIRFWNECDDDDLPEFAQPKTEAEMRRFAKSQGMDGSKLENFIMKWREARRGK